MCCTVAVELFARRAGEFRLNRDAELIIVGLRHEVYGDGGGIKTKRLMIIRNYISLIIFENFGPNQFSEFNYHTMIIKHIH